MSSVVKWRSGTYFFPLFCNLQDDDKNFRRAPSWRKKFRPKDVRGGFSSDTLPANFRVTNSTSTSPAIQPKKHQLDGTYIFKYHFSVHSANVFQIHTNIQHLNSSTMVPYQTPPNTDQCTLSSTTEHQHTLPGINKY